MTEAGIGPAIEITSAVAMGIGLAACAGLRAFLPLLAVGLAGRLDFVPLAPAFEWLEGTAALVTFGVAVVVELLGDKFPVIDHLLDAIAFVIKPIAGTLVATSLLGGLEPLPATVIGLVTGGTTAAAVHLVKAKLRLLSTGLTAGTANPLISTAEDVGAATGSLLALAVPLVFLALVAALVAIALRAVLRRARRRRGAQSEA